MATVEAINIESIPPETLARGPIMGSAAQIYPLARLHLNALYYFTGSSMLLIDFDVHEPASYLTSTPYETSTQREIPPPLFAQPGPCFLPSSSPKSCTRIFAEA
ncbi:hypothetical protein HYFRA_00002624 [Hymenoscyphus fraxineus]|uniref:Uncharacterized protein n=1 Tax=Hymenoscyphus fraxineus TaxID=746836 RepID=A0A9N9LBH4_9HELO|nr:hypothetical protein HYFRA_00002624 [Hymenoscyphus fraxineus]